MRPAIKVGLSTASVYPLRTEAAFEYAAELGYDGVELMVWAEAISQDVGAIAKLSRRYSMPVLSVHAPCLLISQRVWGANPISKLTRSVQAAERQVVPEALTDALDIDVEHHYHEKKEHHHRADIDHDQR